MIASCTASQKTGTIGSNQQSVMIDSSDYEITIIEPDFDRWYMMRFNPGMDHSNEYYRSKNIFAVSNWNNYLMHGKYRRAINSPINYNPSIDYGIEVNRKLFWYFRYIEENYRVPLTR